MGYERDPDHATRGPGAIAALDRPGSVRAQKRAIAARATIVRDRKMSAVARGALGRIDQAVMDRDARSRAPSRGVTPVKVVAPAPITPIAPIMPVKVAPTYGGGGIALTTPSQIMTSFPTRAPALPPLPGRLPTPSQIMRPPTISPIMPPIVSPPIIALPQPVITPGAVVTTTTTTPATATTPATTTTVRTTSTTGGGGLVTGGSKPGIQIGPPGSLPPLQIQEPATDNTMRNVLLVGAGGLALILLLRNRGGR